MSDLTADQRLARYARAVEHAWQTQKVLDRAKAEDLDARAELHAAIAAMSADEERRAYDAIAFPYDEIRVTARR